MSTAVVDARGWQNTLDLETGEKVERNGPIVAMVKEVLQKHPYPGDLDAKSNRWVSDAALDLIDRYAPRFVLLAYASQYFAGRHIAMATEERAKLIADAFLETERFIDKSGFNAIVVGTGDMIPLVDFIDATGLDGLAVSTHWSTRYAGLHRPSRKDMETLRANPHIENIVPREEVAKLFRGKPEETSRLPEYLMLAAEGYAFRTVSDVKRTPVMLPALNFSIPLHAPGREAADITGVRKAIEEDIAERNVALIVMEGVGLEDFSWPCSPCRNGVEWFFYEPGEAQYLTIVSGRHRFLDYPTGSGQRYTGEAMEATRRYPFSGHFKSIPDGVFGGSFSGRSIAVGNKSMFMHMVSGADVSIECFARNLYNQGTMGVIHREDKG